MHRIIQLSQFLANILVAMVVVTLVALHDQKNGVTELDQGGPAAAEAALVESGGARSCGENGIVLNALHQALEEALPPSPPPTTQATEDTAESVCALNGWKPVAHLTGVSMTLHNESDGELGEVTGWLEAGEGKILMNGFRVRGGRLVVPTQGWYRFYAFVMFQARGPREDSVHFQVQLYRKDAADFTDHKLSSQGHVYVLGQVSAVTAISWLREYGLYIQAVHQLKALDELYIKVSPLSALEGNKEWHYMGAHMV